jgi:DNA-directed RNA polymerase subunit K/omega
MMVNQAVIALKEIAEGLIDMTYFDTRRRKQTN